MDAVTAAVDLQLPGKQVAEGSPDNKAPAERKQEAHVQRPGLTPGARIYGATVLTVIAAIELTWFGLLGYGLYSLL